MQMLLAIDLGTSGCRAVLYDTAGVRRGEHYREYETLHPAAGAAEQRPEDWWQAVCECIRGAICACGCGAEVIAAGISAQGHSWVPTAPDGTPLRPAMTWLDTRAAPQAQALLAAKGAQFWGESAGKLPGSWHLLPQLLWLGEHESHVLGADSRFLFAQDVLLEHLTAQFWTDFTTAAGSLLLDIREFAYKESLLDEYGIRREALCPLTHAGTRIGTLTPRAALETGLPESVVVAAGAQDQKCAALGAGIKPGVATASLGTSTAITALTPQPVFDSHSAIPCFPYLQEGTWVLEAPLVTSGAAYRWLRNVLREAAGPGRPDYEALDALAGKSSPGAGGVQFYPFLAGAGAPHWNSQARGAFTGLHLDTHAGDLARAVLEGVAYEIRTNVETMRALGAPLEALRVFGGGARSEVWVQIIADVLGMTVELCADVETAATGAAMLGGVAAGVFSDLAQAQAAFGTQTRRYEPGEATGGYEELYAKYVAQRESIVS